MAYASIAGRAKIDPKNPEALGICDRCNFTYNLKDLVWQHQYRGNNLTDIRLRVCRLTCLDIPHEFERPLHLPPDPPPVNQPRPGNMAVQESGPQAWDGANEYWDENLNWDQAGNSNTDVDPNL